MGCGRSSTAYCDQFYVNYILGSLGRTTRKGERITGPFGPRVAVHMGFQVRRIYLASGYVFCKLYELRNA